MKKFVLGSVIFALVVIVGVSTPQRAHGFIDRGITWCCIGPIGWGMPSFGYFGLPIITVSSGYFGLPIITVSRSIVIDIQIPSDIGDRVRSLQQNQSTKRPDVFLPTDFPSGAATQIACVLNRMENLPSGTDFKLKKRLERMVFWNFEVVILDPKEWASRPENKGKDPEDAPLGESSPPTGPLTDKNIPVLPPGADFRTKLKIAINVAKIQSDIRKGLFPKGATADTEVMTTFVHELAHYVIGDLVPNTSDHPSLPESDRRFWISRWSVRYAQLWKELFGVEPYMREYARNHVYTLPPCTPGSTFDPRGFDFLGFDGFQGERNLGGTLFP